MSDPGIIVSLTIFIITFAVIMSEKVHRAVAAMGGAATMIVAGTWMGFYSMEDAYRAIDMETITLLFCMMVILAMLEKTGFFEFIAIYVAKKSRGNPVVLLISLGTITTVASMFLDNVTTVVLIAPVTILIARMLGLNPIPYLMAEALLANTGGVSTLVGDPPNIMIGSCAHLSFMDFIVHLGPQVLGAWLTALAVLLLVFRKSLAKTPKNIEGLMKMDAGQALHDRKNAYKLLGVLACVIVLFFICHILHFNPSLVALMGAFAGLLLVRPNIEEVFKSVEISVLIFFAALFMAVGGLEHSGVLKLLAGQILVIAKDNLLLCAIVTIWVSAIASAIVDNIPFTMAMLPVIKYMGTQGINICPLWWALAMGVGFGGNGTPIGSTANVIVVSLSEKTQYPITMKIWLKSGLLVMLATCLITTITYSIFFQFYLK